MKQTKSLFKKLIKDEKKYIICSRYNHQKYYLDLEDENVLHESENLKTNIPFYTSFVEQRKDIDWSSVLYSVKAPFEVVHNDMADIQFFSKSAVDPKYCLLAVDLFTSKRYVYLMKSRNPLARKLEVFYQNIKSLK